MLLYLLVPLVFTLLLNWQNAKAFNTRYILTSLPMFLCVIAAGIVSLPKMGARITGLAVAITLVISLGNYFFSGVYAREDVRGAARVLEDRLASDSNACILAPAITEVFEYYYEGASPVHSIYAPIGTSRKRIDEQAARVLAECGEIWYVRARHWVYDPDDYVGTRLEAAATRSEVITFDGVTVIRYTR